MPKQNARETGIIEEILLDNRLINPHHSLYSIRCYGEK